MAEGSTVNLAYSSIGKLSLFSIQIGLQTLLELINISNVIKLIKRAVKTSIDCLYLRYHAPFYSEVESVVISVLFGP